MDHRGKDTGGGRVSSTTLKIVGRLADNFTMVANDFTRNPAVTPRAARLYIYLASHQTGWKLSIAAAINATGMSRGTVFAALKDLRLLGYVKRYQIVDEADRFAGTEYQVFDVPVPESDRDDVEGGADSRIRKSSTRDEQGKCGETAGEARVIDFGIRESGIRKNGTLKNTNTKKTNLEENQEEYLAQGELAPASRPAPDGFDEWWDLYPRKVARKKAEQAYKAALRGGATPAELLTGLEASRRSWAIEGREKTKLPYPATWLNQGRWEDEETTTADTVPKEPQRESFMDVGERLMARFDADDLREFER